MHSLELVIDGLLATLGGRNEAEAPGLIEAAARWAALPVCLDMGGCYAIRRDGSVVSWAWDDDSDCLRVEADPRIRNLAFFQGALRYPELAPFMPIRPAEAAVCDACDGSGRPKGFPPHIKNVICACGGCGWLPPEDSRSNSGGA